MKKKIVVVVVGLCYRNHFGESFRKQKSVSNGFKVTFVGCDNLVSKSFSLWERGLDCDW